MSKGFQLLTLIIFLLISDNIQQIQSAKSERFARNNFNHHNNADDRYITYGHNTNSNSNNNNNNRKRNLISRGQHLRQRNNIIGNSQQLLLSTNGQQTIQTITNHDENHTEFVKGKSKSHTHIQTYKHTKQDH